jgi:hypothetical protein
MTHLNELLKSTAAITVLGATCTLHADHILGHENDDPTFPCPIPGQQDFSGGIMFVTLIGPIEGMVITGTTFDITYVSDGTTPASDLLLHGSVMVDDDFVEFNVTGADLGFGSGPGTFHGTLHTDSLNGEAWESFFFPPYSIVNLEVGAVDGAIQGTGYFVDSFIIFDVPGDGCPADTDGDGTVGVTDLTNVILDWGCTKAPCAGDVDDDGQVGVNDLIEVITNWGDC